MFDDITLPHPAYVDHVKYHTYVMGGRTPTMRA